MTDLSIRENVPLAPFTTLGIGGPARYFAEATTELQAARALAYAWARNLPLFVLGGGSNLLVSDEGFPGLVLRIAIRGIVVHDEGKSGLVSVGAGEDWDSFVAWCVERGWAGAECLSGIPGTVGGTPIQNVGAYGQEASEIIASVQTLERKGGAIRTLLNSECGFTYRKSIFNSSSLDCYIVLRVTYALRIQGKTNIEYPDLKRHFAGRSGRPSIPEVREAVRSIRASKAMLLVPGDPDCHSAGSFFKNPIVSREKYTQISEAAQSGGCVKEGESVPQFGAPSGQVKVPAAWLIERAGFHKGLTRGRVGLSSKHTLALINRGGATAAEAVALMREIQGSVRNVFGVDLSPEPVFVGFDSA